MVYPLLEYDSTRQAFIEPSQVIQPADVPAHCIICFFRDVIERVAQERQAKVLVPNRWEDGPHPLYEIAHNGQRLAFFHPGVGGPLAAGLLEEVIALGCRKFIACGGCGVLAQNIAVGHLVVLDAAVRDEGTSYHYLPPGREIEADPRAADALVATLARRGVPYLVGKSWTTDAPYRETPHKIAMRRDEGCLVVEMEAASMMAVARFRDVAFGQVVYGGDDLSGSEWDTRDWQKRATIREQLFWLCADAVLAL
jgi:uridine phosphorylase